MREWKLQIGRLLLIGVHAAGCQSGMELRAGASEDATLVDGAEEGLVVATGWSAFVDVPPEVATAAREAWGSEEPPAVTLAFGYRPEALEAGWSFGLTSARVENGAPGCVVGAASEYLERDRFVARGGFVFLQEEDLCGPGMYEIDNQQGGWFDYVCGPQGSTFRYEGRPILVFVHLWCE